MFLSMSDAIAEITAAIKEGLGPIALLSDPTGLMQALPGTIMDLIIQFAATIILFIAVRFLFWKPITNILEARRAAMDKELEEAQAARQSATEIQAQLNNELNEAKAKVKAMLDQAEKDANIKRDEIVSSAKEEARRRMENLEIELEQERKNMEKDIKKEIVDIAFAAAEKIVAKEIDQNKYMDVVDDILKGGC